ncbi:MAG: glycosylhydrolase-like jelly roll fold domain-containing protein, partial [Minisyncoccia bacterium]
ELSAYGSAFVVFRGRIQKSESRSQNAGKQWRAEPATPSAPDSGSQAHPSKGDGKTEEKVGTDRRAVRGEPESGGSSGPALPKNFPQLKPVMELTGPWSVQFDPKWGGPKDPVTFEKLTDWTTNPLEGVKCYSGTATYRMSFEYHLKPSDSKSKIFLDLGVVNHLAAVRMNGKNLGVVWCAPWQVDVASAIQNGRNELEIDIVNPWVNRLAADVKLPEEKRVTAMPKRCPPNVKDLPRSSGLLGPVRLMMASENR